MRKDYGRPKHLRQSNNEVNVRKKKTVWEKVVDDYE